MEKLIDIASRAVADYGFRQAVLYGANDIGRRSGLSPKEQETLEGLVIEFLAALPIPVQPEDIPSEQVRVGQAIRAAAGG
jgi:hypothetical protein